MTRYEQARRDQLAAEIERRYVNTNMTTTVNKYAVALTEAAVAAAPDKPKEWTRPGPDRSLIWEDCPACAYKHLTAAYAALTAADRVGAEAKTSEIYAARAVIAIRESDTGYPGNGALAQGCLAMAECLDEEEASSYRDSRMAILEGGPCSPEIFFSVPSPTAFAAAHFTEALRELPELADRIAVAKVYGPHGFHPDKLSEVRELLRTNIKWLADTYELNKGTNA